MPPCAVLLELLEQRSARTHRRVHGRSGLTQNPNVALKVALTDETRWETPDEGILMTRILILDDEPGLAALIGEILTLDGYECLCTADSHKALDILRNERVDLFIQDCLRCDIDGMELYGLLKAEESLRSIPVLFQSAGINPNETATIRSPYGDEHLQKPFTRQAILAVITTLLKRFGKHVPTTAEKASDSPG